MKYNRYIGAITFTPTNVTPTMVAPVTSGTSSGSWTSAVNTISNVVTNLANSANQLYTNISQNQLTQQQLQLQQAQLQQQQQNTGGNANQYYNNQQATGIDNTLLMGLGLAAVVAVVIIAKRKKK